MLAIVHVQYSPDYLKLPDPLPVEGDDMAAPLEDPIQSASSAEPSTKVRCVIG